MTVSIGRHRWAGPRDARRPRSVRDRGLRLLLRAPRSPDGIRTRATALRGRRARPLHNGAVSGTERTRHEKKPYREGGISPNRTTLPWTRAGVPGLEPRMTEPETVVLPITPYPKGFHSERRLAAFCGGEPSGNVTGRPPNPQIGSSAGPRPPRRDRGPPRRPRRCRGPRGRARAPAY